MNEKLSSNIVQSHMEKKNLEMELAIVDLQKTNVNLQSRLKQSHNEEAEFNSELENMKKIVKMLYSGFLS